MITNRLRPARKSPVRASQVGTFDVAAGTGQYRSDRRPYRTRSPTAATFAPSDDAPAGNYSIDPARHGKLVYVNPEADAPKPTIMGPPGAMRYQAWLSRRRLTAITDSCSLASSAGHVARDGRASIIAALASRGRTPVFISENVEAELPKAIDEVARSMGIPAAEVEAVMREQVLPRIRVVPLRVGDYLHPRIAGIRRDHPSLPRAMRGDPDDLGTAALAQFLAPAVVISKDSVFNRFGLALPAAQWLKRPSGC